MQITKLKKTELIIISIILNLLIGTQEPLIINSWAQDNNEVIIWNWSHWEDENFDPNQMSEGQEQSDPIEIWTLTITFSNIFIILGTLFLESLHHEPKITIEEMLFDKGFVFSIIFESGE